MTTAVNVIDFYIFEGADNINSISRRGRYVRKKNRKHFTFVKMYVKSGDF